MPCLRPWENYKYSGTWLKHLKIQTQKIYDRPRIIDVGLLTTVIRLLMFLISNHDALRHTPHGPDS